MSIVKRGFDSGSSSPSPRGGAAKRRRAEGAGGFGSVSTQEMAAQVAAARDMMLRDMRMKEAGGGGAGAGQDKATSSRMSMEAQQTLEVRVDKRLVQHLMTPEHRQLLAEESGAEVEWAPEASKVKLVGSPKALSTAKRFLARVEMHCHWGATQAKVRKLLRRHMGLESVLVRLSPMTVNSLKPGEKTLNGKETTFSIGKEKTNDVVVQDTSVSRQHCVISFDTAKGAVYVADLSTNGTFLNGIRLPSKKLGKVLLSHGDEILFKDPSSGDMEFGYICNLSEISVRAEVKLEAPKRILSAEETSIARGY